MKKSISPAFAAIVIIIVLIVGLLYFMTQLRSDQVRWEREKAAAQAQAERAKTMRQAGAIRPGSRRGRGGSVPGSEAPSGVEPGAGSSTEAPGE